MFAVTALARVLLSGVLLFCVLPAVIFTRSAQWTAADTVFGGVLKGAAAVIICVYSLVALRVYEFPSFTVVFLALAVIRIARVPPRALRVRLDSVAVAFLELVDRNQRAATPGQPDRPRRSRSRRWGVWHAAIAAATLAVLIMAAFLRLYYPLIHAAPALSDAYVTLAWMKYMESKQLFHDGVYPHGFHAVLSVLRKISGIDPLLVLKFAGPLSCLLTVAGAWYCATSVTRSPVAGLAAAFVLGVLSRILPLDLTRQASTNSQEFGMAFVLPVVAFLGRYLDKGDRSDLIAASAGLAVTGLVHPLPALAAGVSGACCVAARAVCRTLDLGRLRQVTLAGVWAVLVSAAPLAAGLLCGIEPHGSSLAFATSRENAALEAVSPIALVALLSAIAALVVSLLHDTRRRCQDALACLLVTVSSLAIWQAPRLGVGSLVLSTRGGEFGSLGITLGIASGVGALNLERSGPAPARKVLAGLVLLALTAAGWSTGLRPATAYRMQSDAWVDQYLRIATTNPPHEWLIAGEERGYALALGTGWHMGLEEFLTTYDSRRAPLVAGQGSDRGKVLPVGRVFLFLEKNIPPTPAALAEGVAPLSGVELARKARLAVELGAWIDEYRECHQNISLYFQGDDLEVWLVDQSDLLRDDWKSIWEPGGSGEDHGP